jgi:formyl-CoA transferase
VAGRNKRSVTIDLQCDDGRRLAQRLAGTADVVITNLARPVLLAGGLDGATLLAGNPKLVVLEVSAFGRTSSRRDEDGAGVGAGTVAEAMSGVPQLTGPAGGPPVFNGFAQAETMTALMGAFAIQAALYRRDRDPDFAGECIDLALFEPLFRLVEWQVVVHDQTGTIFQRAGNQMALGSDGVVDTYRTDDGDWIVITSGTKGAVANLARLLGQPASPPPGVPRLKALLTDWVKGRGTSDCLRLLAEAGVSASRSYSVADIVDDDVFVQRRSITTVDDEQLGPVRMPSALPHLLNHPGRIWRTGPGVGADNEAVFRDELGLSDDELGRLARDGVI